MEEKILDKNEAATFLKMAPETLRRKAHAGEIPACKSGKNWVFVDVDLLLYIRSQYHDDNNIYLRVSKINEDIARKPEKIKVPHLPRGGYMSQRKIEKEYEKLMMSANKKQS